MLARVSGRGLVIETAFRPQNRAPCKKGNRKQSRSLGAESAPRKAAAAPPRLARRLATIYLGAAASPRSAIVFLASPSRRKRIGSAIRRSRASARSPLSQEPRPSEAPAPPKLLKIARASERIARAIHAPSRSWSRTNAHAPLRSGAVALPRAFLFARAHADGRGDFTARATAAVLRTLWLPKRRGARDASGGDQRQRPSALLHAAPNLRPPDGPETSASVIRVGAAQYTAPRGCPRVADGANRNPGSRA